MARRDRRGGPQGHVPGFRPGREPAHLRKQQMKQQLGSEGGAQERLIDLFADKSPAEARALIRRWELGLLIGAVVLGILGVALYLWSIIAGILVHILAAGVLFLWWQIRRKRGDLETVADMVGRKGGGGRGRDSGRGGSGKRRGP